MTAEERNADTLPAPAITEGDADTVIAVLLADDFATLGYDDELGGAQ